MLGSRVPPMMEPPSWPRGMTKDQVPLAFWRVMVRGKGLETRTVWPVAAGQYLARTPLHSTVIGVSRRVLGYRERE